MQTCQVSRISRETHAFWPQIASHARRGVREHLSHSSDSFHGISQHLLNVQETMTYQIPLEFHDKAISGM